MSGHSKWSTIKRSKAANDAKRGKIFTKIGHEIVIAVGQGGSDPDANFRLRLILEKAKRANMPKDNVERAIKRGSGELIDGGTVAEYVYEGYGPHGTAIMVQALTDKKNRAVADIRHAFSRHGGNLGSEGCVAWMFSQKGYVAIRPGEHDPEEVALVAIDAGADDVEIDDELVEVYTRLADFRAVQDALSEVPFEIVNAQLSRIPQSTIRLEDKQTIQTMKLLDALEDLEDVEEVFSNLDIGDEMIAKYEAEAA